MIVKYEYPLFWIMI